MLFTACSDEWKITPWNISNKQDRQNIHDMKTMCSLGNPQNSDPVTMASFLHAKQDA